MPFGTAGNKQNWAREIDSPVSFQDLLGITAAQAALLQFVSGKSVTDIDGVKHNVLTMVHNSASIDPTLYYKAGVGSRIYAVGLATPAIYVKCVDSSPAVIGDWYLEELTQAS